MKLFDYIESNKDKEIDIYCDMDGVLAEYDIGNFDYNTIRPLQSNIDNLEKISKYSNVNIYILSICHNDRVVEEKYVWLDKYMKYIDQNKCIFISKDKTGNVESCDLKSNYLKNNSRECINIVIDDDIKIIKTLIKNNSNVKVFHVSSLIS